MTNCGRSLKDFAGRLPGKVFITMSLPSSERQIVRGITLREIHGRRIPCRWKWRRLRLLRRCGVGDTLHFPSTDTVVPTSLVFARVNIKGHRELVADLNRKLGYLVRPEYIETHLPGILFLRFQHIFLHFPFRSGALRNASPFGQHCNDFSGNFHIVVFIC